MLSASFMALTSQFNSVTPKAGPPGCKSASCAANVNTVCDPNLAVRGPDGSVIACKSARMAFREIKFCCTGQYKTPDKCHPNQYSTTFKQKCPQAYTCAFDDATGKFNCPSGSDYFITFCP
jgi:hypothetical protein